MMACNSSDDMAMLPHQLSYATVCQHNDTDTCPANATCFAIHQKAFYLEFNVYDGLGLPCSQCIVTHTYKVTAASSDLMPGNEAYINLCGFQPVQLQRMPKLR